MATLHALFEQVIHKACQHLPGADTPELRAAMIADMHEIIPANARLTPDSPFQVLVQLSSGLDVDHPLVDRETTDLGYRIARILQTTTTRFKSLASTSVETIVQRAERMLSVDANVAPVTPVRVCTWAGLNNVSVYNAALEVLTTLNIPLDQLRDRHLSFMALHVKAPVSRWVMTDADQLVVKQALETLDVDAARTRYDLKSNVTAANVIVSLKRAITEPNSADRRSLMPTVDRIEAMHLALEALATCDSLSPDFHAGLSALRETVTNAQALLALAREMIFRTALVLPGSSRDVAYVNGDLIEHAPEQLSNADVGLVVQYADHHAIPIPVRGMPQATVTALLPKAQAIRTALESERAAQITAAAKRQVVSHVTDLINDFHLTYLKSLPATEAAVVTHRLQENLGTLRVQLGRYELAPIDQSLASFMCRTYGSRALADMYSVYTKKAEAAVESLADGTTALPAAKAQQALLASAAACMWRTMMTRQSYQHREYGNLVA